MDAQNKLKQIATPRTIYNGDGKGQKFSGVESLSVSIESNDELAVFTLKGSEMDSEATLILGALCSHDGQWKFRTVGVGFNGNLQDVRDKSNYIEFQYLFDSSIINGEHGNTLLIKACKEKHEENITFLYQKHVDFNLKNNDGESAVDILQKHNQLPEKLQALKEKLILEQSITEEVDLNYGL